VTNNIDELATPRDIVRLMSMATDESEMNALRHALVAAVRRQIAEEDATAAAEANASGVR
jgi:hypothetical protein